MTVKQSRALRIGDRLKFAGYRGIVTKRDGTDVYILWDDGQKSVAHVRDMTDFTLDRDSDYGPRV